MQGSTENLAIEWTSCFNITITIAIIGSLILLVAKFTTNKMRDSMIVIVANCNIKAGSLLNRNCITKGSTSPCCLWMCPC